MATYGYDGYPHAPHVADPYAATYGPYGAPPAPGGFPPPAYPDEVRTIFITGFPADVKERELNNLLRFLPGYEASQMNYKHGQAQGFALFATGALARAAIENIQHLCFDGESCVLRCEMAHKNMYLKDEPSAKRTKYGSAPGSYGAYGGSGSTPPPSGSSAPSRPAGYAPISNTKDNPPCNTLFIGNLGDTVNETELKGIFSTQAGFKQLKLVRGAKNVTCFVEFEDVSTAMQVHASLQGAILNSSDRGGIRIQYSKNPFGRKRDSSGNEIMPTM